jgi:Bacterial PH domain
VSDHDHAPEPVPGLPEHLPAGERMLWQGSPSWRALAVRALHVRKVAAYFALLAAWHVVEATGGGATFLPAVRGALWLLLLGAAAVGVLALLAWALARSTIYTVTSARVVLRFGVALPMSINLPLRLVEAADLVRHGDGTADLQLTLAHGQRVGYLLTWPHVQPWRLFRVRPTLRAVADADAAATALTAAFAATQGTVASTNAAPRPARAPATSSLPRPASTAAA